MDRREVWQIGPEDATWMARARRLEAFQCDVAFRVAESFYIGPENGDELSWREAIIRLPPVDLPLFDRTQVLSVDLLGREDRIIAHYRRLLQVAEEHGKCRACKYPFPYFALHPVLIADRPAMPTFPWSDDVPNARQFLDAIIENAPGGSGVIIDDQDQGWRIRFALADGSMYFIEWDAEGRPPDDGGFVVDADTLAQQAKSARDRLATIHARLIHALGQDYWTYRHDPPLKDLERRFRMRAILAAFDPRRWWIG